MNPAITEELIVESTPSHMSGLTDRLKVTASMLSTRFWVSIFMITSIMAFAFIGPYVSGQPSPKTLVGGLFDAPARGIWLGTDNFGRDIYTQLMYGTQTSLMIGIVAGAVATVIGVTVGTIAGFKGGIFEEVIMGATNVVITIPSIVVLILLSIAVGTRTLMTMAIIIGVTGWPWTARAVRAQASSLRNREHVDLARITGANSLSLILWEILPFMLSYIFLAFVLQMASSILQEAALSLIGLGPADTTSLGTMLFWSLRWEAARSGAWWAFMPPAIMLTLITFSLLLLTSSLDEVFNPRLRRR